MKKSFVVIVVCISLVLCSCANANGDTDVSSAAGAAMQAEGQSGPKPLSFAKLAEGHGAEVLNAPLQSAAGAKDESAEKERDENAEAVQDKNAGDPQDALIPLSAEMGDTFPYKKGDKAAPAAADGLAHRFAEICREEIAFISIDDYDFDGTQEGFAVTRGENAWCCRLWFLDQEKVKLLDDNISLDEDCYVFKVPGCHTYLCLEASAPYLFSRIWGVEDGEAAEAPISNIGIGFRILEDNCYAIEQSEYDGLWADGSAVGVHTWKPYYFYYDYDYDNKKGAFREYGASEMTMEEFRSFSGADDALKLIREKDGEITSILLRSNGLVHVNYSVREVPDSPVWQRHCNVTYKLKDGALSDPVWEDGDYLPALVPKIAVY